VPKRNFRAGEGELNFASGLLTRIEKVLQEIELLPVVDPRDSGWNKSLRAFDEVSADA